MVNCCDSLLVTIRKHSPDNQSFGCSRIGRVGLRLIVVRVHCVAIVVGPGSLCLPKKNMLHGSVYGIFSYLHPGSPWPPFFSPVGFRATIVLVGAYHHPKRNQHFFNGGNGFQGTLGLNLWNPCSPRNTEPQVNGVWSVWFLGSKFTSKPVWCLDS